MIQRVDVGAAVRVHREHIAGIADVPIDLARLPGQVVDDRTRRGV
jgi:hypothetical protein